MINFSFNFEKFRKFKALFDQIVITYQPMFKQIFPIKNGWFFWSFTFGIRPLFVLIWFKLHQIVQYSLILQLPNLYHCPSCPCHPTNELTKTKWVNLFKSLSLNKIFCVCFQCDQPLASLQYHVIYKSQSKEGNADIELRLVLAKPFT
jgi:hypothetical protein